MNRSIDPRFPVRLAVFCLAGYGIASPLLADDPLPAHVIDAQQIADLPPLEIKTLLAEVAGQTRLGAAVLYNNGTDNVIDLFSLNPSESGVNVVTRHEAVVTGSVFALGELCEVDGQFIVPFSNNFDVQSIRWNDVNFSSIPIDDSATNHTMTDCVELDNDEIAISAFNFDFGRFDFYSSINAGLSYNLKFSYAPEVPAIDPFSGAFRFKAGAVRLLGGALGTDIGLTYQLQSGDLESVALNSNDGTIRGGPMSFEAYASHHPFIDNGYLKEIMGIALDELPFAVGTANGGETIGLSWINLNNGDPGFRLLNDVTTQAFDFQGLGLAYSLSSETFFIHSFTNQHIRFEFGPDGPENIEQISYPWANIGGPVSAASGPAVNRIYVTVAGFPAGDQVQGAGIEPSLMVITMDPDPAVMLGTPFGSSPPPPAVPVPLLSRGIWLGLAILLALIGLAWLRVRVTAQA